MVSFEETLPVEAKPWATQKRRTGKADFQTHTKSAAAQVVGCCFQQKYERINGQYQPTDFIEDFQVYKLTDKGYEKVFDSESQVADLFLCGALTKAQVLARIFEE